MKAEFVEYIERTDIDRVSGKLGKESSMNFVSVQSLELFFFN